MNEVAQGSIETFYKPVSYCNGNDNDNDTPIEHDRDICTVNDIVIPVLTKVIGSVIIPYIKDNQQLNSSYEISIIHITKETVAKFRPNRRSATMNRLLKECFENNQHNKDDKQSAFCTNKPLLWYEAIKKYIARNCITNRCDLSKNRDDKVTIM